MGLNLCDRCVADCRHERNPDEIVIKCGAYKPPMTNADRIRAMSDEELADFMVVNICPLKQEQCPRTCKQCWLEWLQQPYKEDET